MGRCSVVSTELNWHDRTDLPNPAPNTEPYSREGPPNFQVKKGTLSVVDGGERIGKKLSGGDKVREARHV